MHEAVRKYLQQSAGAAAKQPRYAKRKRRVQTASVRNGLYVTGKAQARIVNGGLPSLGKKS